MNILIIGGGGFLGQELYRYFKINKFNVFCTSHQDVLDENFIKLDMSTELGGDILGKYFEAVIYCTHIYNIDKSEELISWYKKTFFLLAKNTKKQIYISSYSANPNAISNYGKTKYSIEKFFIQNNAYSISPGLIVGDGGIYKKIENVVLRLPIIVLPINKQENNLAIVDILDICIFISSIIDGDIKRKNYNIWNEVVSLKILIQRIANKNNKKRIIFGLNASFTLKVMQVLENIGIKLPITSDSLIGFIFNQKYDIKSDITMKDK